LASSTYLNPMKRHECMHALHADAAIQTTVHAVGAAVRRMFRVAPHACTHSLFDVITASVVP
jgi:hypothetical protein